MELTISKKAFLKAIGRTHPVADRKSSMPILCNILLTAAGPNTLRLASTDLYLFMSCVAEAKVDSEGSVAVGARTLYDIVKNLPDGEVSLKVQDNFSAVIRVGKVRFRIPGMPGQEFPTPPTPGDAPFAELDAEPLGRLIALTGYSMSFDETRPHLTCALFQGKDRDVRMVTTDGHRLSKAEYQQAEDRAALGFSMLVPNKGIAELRRMVDDVCGEAKGANVASIGVACAGGSAFFQHGDVLLSVKLVDEKFPPYEKVIPTSHSRRVVVSRHSLIDALKRISLVANDKSGAVRFAAETGFVRLTSENPEVGEGSEELDVDFVGESVEIGFNARYLVDALSSLTEDDVALELGSALEPGVVRPIGDTNFHGVVMPMRI